MIKVDQYARKMGLFDMHIELLRLSVEHFSKDKGAVQTFVNRQEQECSRRVDIVLAIDKDGPRDQLDDIFVKAEGNKLRREIQHHVEFAESRLHQTEIILRCAFFEAEMKNIHRHCLCAKPTLLRGETEIALGRLISKGEDAVLKEELEAEVERLDRQNVKERAKYFRDKLGVKWADPKLFQQYFRLKSKEDHADMVAVVDRLSELRNKIVHRDTGYVVKRDELDAARNYFTFVPTFCCQQAVRLYPEQFSEK